jgi:hypothetical protein
LGATCKFLASHPIPTRFRKTIQKEKPMKISKTLSQSIEELKAQGYTEDFNLTENAISCAGRNLQLHPENFTIDFVQRFEGMSSTDDNSILYAISSDQGLKGLLVDAYGVYAASLSPAMIEKLRVGHSEIR